MVRKGKATRAAPNGWQVWLGAGDPEAFPHTDKNQVRTGEASWNFKQGFTAFTAAGFQRVTGLTDGTALNSKTLSFRHNIGHCPEQDKQRSLVHRKPPVPGCGSAVASSV